MKHIFYLLFMSLCSCGFSQMDKYWLIGYQNYEGGMGADIVIESDGTIHMDTVSRPINFSESNASISSGKGNLLFSSNGIFIADKNNNLIPGAILYTEEGPDTSNADYGSSAQQSVFIIPIPNDTNRFYLLHLGFKYLYLTSPDVYGHGLYTSILDKSLNNGNGGVINLNTLFLEDTFAVQGLTAVQHANGRDWWIVMPTEYADEYYTILLTPQGLQTPNLQKINEFPHALVHVGPVVFGRNGGIFVRAGSGYTTNHHLYIMHFDRCSGHFYDEQDLFISTATSAYFMGIAISPNEKYCYVSEGGHKVYQYDLTSADILGSRTLIATHNGAGGIFGGFGGAYLAPNDKIYIVDNTNTMSVINEPNVEGIACNLQQHIIQLPVINGITVPNYPNFYLGPLVGSGCDTLVSSAPPIPQAHIKVYPNPAGEVVNVEMPASWHGVAFELRDVQGKEILRQTLTDEKSVIFVGNTAEGMFFYKIETENQQYYGKLWIIH